MPIFVHVRFGGGYALVDNRARDQFDVASIRPSSPDHLVHRLAVRAVGAISNPPAPDDLDGKQTMGWDLNARIARMEIWPGGVLPVGAMTPPSQADCRDHLPDVPELGRSALARRWRDRIDALLTLREGMVSVDRANLAEGKVVFRHPSRAAKPQQRLANGVTGLIYEVDSQSHSSVTLALYELATGDDAILGGLAPVATYEITPSQGNLVTLQVDSLEVGKIMRSGMDLKEFGIFYNLLDPVPRASDQYIPTWSKAGAIPASPGSECPPGFFNDPNP